MDIILKIPTEQRAALICEIKNALKEELADFKSTSKIEEHHDDEYFNRKEACKFLRCSLATLYNYQKTGKLTCLKIGRKVLYNKAELLSNLYQIGKRGQL